MLLKTEDSILKLKIHSETSLDDCIMRLEGSNTFTSCSLHFSVSILPSEKITDLTALIKKQINLETLVLTADVSLKACERYAGILETVFTDLSHLKSLTFRGLFSDCTAKILINLIEHTKTLSVLSVGACYVGQRCYVIPETKSTGIVDALEQNTTLTQLDLRRNILNESGVATIIKNLSINTSLKILNLSDNIPSGKYKINYSGEGMLELLQRHEALEEIHTDGLVISPLKFKYTSTSNEQFANACACLSSMLTVRHLDLSLSAFEVTSENLNLLALTINNLPQLQKLQIYGLSSKGFQILCQQSLIKPGSLSEVAFIGVSNPTKNSGNSLIELIKCNTHLTSLTFTTRGGENCNWMGYRQDLALGKVLGENRNLIYFELNHTKLDSKVVAGIIAKNNCLQVLNLENNLLGFRETGVNSILDSLSKNQTLLTLNLCSNNLLFPKNITKKIHLTDFQILNYPGALERAGDWGYYSDFELENKILPESYYTINEMTRMNRQRILVQKYLLLRHLGTQENLNTDLINIILGQFLCSFESFELKKMEKVLRKSEQWILVQKYLLLHQLVYPDVSNIILRQFLCTFKSFELKKMEIVLWKSIEENIPKSDSHPKSARIIDEQKPRVVETPLVSKSNKSELKKDTGKKFLNAQSSKAWQGIAPDALTEIDTQGLQTNSKLLSVKYYEPIEILAAIFSLGFYVLLKECVADPHNDSEVIDWDKLCLVTLLHLGSGGLAGILAGVAVVVRASEWGFFAQGQPIEQAQDFPVNRFLSV